jgi:predicted NUDIX family NTP pyrophosphohydrolase
VILGYGNSFPSRHAGRPARREFHEETGAIAQSPFAALGELKQRGGKMVTAWALEGDFDPAQLHSATFRLEWPAGRFIQVPEVDRAQWFNLADAETRLLKEQFPFLQRLTEILRTVTNSIGDRQVPN